MNAPPRIKGNILRLLLVGTGTVLATMALIMLWATVTEGTADMEMMLTYGALVAGSVIVFAVIPSFALWYLAAWLLARTALSSRWIPAGASAATAIACAAFITWAVAGLDSSIAGLHGIAIGGTLAAVSAVVAVGLSLILLRPEPAVQS